jgi:hypothetical protein
MPAEIQPLIQEFADFFTVGLQLPPRRSHDHRIPLLPGAQPIKTRPYRYAPHQKDDIEGQIYQMLRQGIIRNSTSPFASLVMLVCKKDGTW